MHQSGTALQLFLLFFLFLQFRVCILRNARSKGGYFITLLEMLPQSQEVEGLQMRTIFDRFEVCISSTLYYYKMLCILLLLPFFKDKTVFQNTDWQHANLI